jgi:hypothetical protein
MRIAKPLLLITTPVGVVLGVHEAFRLTGGLAFLMIALLLMISAAMAILVTTIRKEERLARQQALAQSHSTAATSQDIP